MPLDFLRDSTCLLGLEALIETCRAMSVQVVGHQDNHVSVRICLFNKEPKERGKVTCRSPLGNTQMAPTNQWLSSQEYVALSQTLIFVIHANRLSRLNWQ